MRPAEVFVRELAPAEGQRLKRLSKQSKLTSTRQRAMILLASNTLMSAPARMLLTDESHVRKVIHDFNRHGFESLRPRFRGGRPRRISIDDEARIVAVAGARPDALGVPYTRCSLAKLSSYLRAGARGLARPTWPHPCPQRDLAATDTQLEAEPRPGVRAEGGPDPRSLPPTARKRRRDQLRREGTRKPLPQARARLGAARPSRAPPRHLQPPPGHPLPGRCARRARRLPADQAAATPQRRLHTRVHEADPARLPQADPTLLDPRRLSSHWTPQIRTWAAANNTELVPTPTYASYLNRIESTFGALDEFVCKNADYLDWDAFGYALADHVRHRNSPAERARRKLEAAKRHQRRTAKTTAELKAAA
jgi:transposase